MTADKTINGWALLIILLVVIIAAGILFIWSGYDGSRTIEIVPVPEPEITGQLYISGKVHNAGIYSLESGDSLEDIFRKAGGVTAGADLSRLELNVPGIAEGELPQKVDINRAEAWLLAALPGIGEGRAQAITDYRELNGPFRDTAELVKVEGIGAATYEKIKDLITVAD